VRTARQTFFHYLGSQRIRLIIGLTTAVGVGFAAVIPPRYIGQIVDSLTQGSPFDRILGLVGLYVVFAGVEAVFRILTRLTVLDASRLIEARMRRDLFVHLQGMELAYFQHQRIGDLMARLTNDLQAVRMMSGMGISQGAQTLITFGFALAAMFALSPRLTLIALVLLPLSSLTFALIGRRVHVRFERLQAKFSDIAAKAQENFSGIRVVKAFAQEDREIRDFTRIAREYFGRAMSLVRMQGAVWPTMSLILGLAVLGVLYIGGRDTIDSHLTIGQLVQFVAYLQLLSLPMVQIGQISNQIQSGWASLGRLQEIFNATPAIADPSDPVNAPIAGGIELRHVSFGYGATEVLHDISFTVAPKHSLAIVGRTGAGKSTLVNLIPRLFDATSGEVLIDGVDIRRYPLQALRRAIGYVPQEPFLFSLPLRDNVGFGLDDGLIEEKLQWAGDVSQLNADVDDFPARYDTMIGERGVTLSGGQKQRLALARAVAKAPAILILDDALSAVDTQTEAEILRRLRGVVRERTSILVAHRISTVKDADEIIVLDRGRIAERGTHSALLERKGLYAAMYRRQLLEEELEVDEDRVAHERRIEAEGGTDAPPLRRRDPAGGSEEGA